MTTKRRYDLSPNYISMLDLLTGALAAFLILFVMVNQKSKTETQDSKQELAEKILAQEKIIEQQNEKLRSLNQQIVQLQQQEAVPEESEKVSVKSGEKFVLRNIHFYPGTSEITYDSHEYLKEVASHLKKENSYFLIQGHVNAPGSSCKKNSARFNTLSLDRAKAVQTFFESHGISKSNMRVDGAGCSQMIYPYAVTEREQTANRRVEILFR